MEEEEKDPDSLLQTVRKILAFRYSREELNSDAPFEFVYAKAESPVLVYRRSKLLIAVNPKIKSATVPVPSAGKVIFRFGETKNHETSLTMGPQSFVVIEQ